MIIAGEMRLKEWQCVSERLVNVRICFEKKWTTFIQVYARKEFKWAILAVTERVAGRRKAGKHRKATAGGALM